MISIQTDDFDLAQETRALKSHTGIGALVCFVGLVRDFHPSNHPSNHPDHPDDTLYIEHYPGMTEATLANLADQAKTRWSLAQVRIVHRIGQLSPGDQIVLVATAAAHRRDAFAACDWLMDMLKTQAPFWKREGDQWVEAKDSDHATLARWQQLDEQ